MDINKLLDFLELRLGLHTVSVSDTDRLVAYFKCVREYMSTHKTDADNQLYGSYTISPLATSREMLKWRDALAVCGWTKDTPAPSRRLKVLQGVEQLFAANERGDMSTRQRNERNILAIQNTEQFHPEDHSGIQILGWNSFSPGHRGYNASR